MFNPKTTDRFVLWTRTCIAITALSLALFVAVPNAFAGSPAPEEIEADLTAQLDDDAIEAERLEAQRAEALTEPAEVEIVAAAIGLGVENRMPTDVGASFQTGQKVWAWLTVANAGTETHVVQVWKRNGQEVWRVQLEVGKSPRWRTWGRKSLRARDVGHWTVEIEDASGNLVDTIEFDVTEAPSENS